MNSLKDTAPVSLQDSPSEKTSTSCAAADSRLPSVEEFLALVEDEAKETSHNLSGYYVYHKYGKSC